MCARFTLTSSPNVIAELFDLDLQIDVGPRFNVAPSQNVLTVRLNPEERPEFAHMRWGLIPSWSNNASIGAKLLNARSETIAEKPSFRDAIRKRRCLIAADGFYEWKTKNKQKLPYFIHKPDRQPFAFAGIWEKWQADDGAVLETCSILTTKANDRLRFLHERMPVILNKKDYSRWLNPAIENVSDLQPLFAPAPNEALAMYAVSQKVNSARFEDPQCIEPGPNEPATPKHATLWDE